MELLPKVQLGQAVIISASYRTDIPTFYGEWFLHRLRVGYCKTRNPYNGRVIRVSLLPEDVSGFVFWTKNIGPFRGALAEVRRRGFPFVVQHTINGYPRVLEQAVVEETNAIENMLRIAAAYGPRVCVWRYDTIVHSSLTDREFHLRTFTRIAKALAGATDEVVVSFAQVYRKTLRNMNQTAALHDFTWEDPTLEWKRDLLVELTAIAADQRMQLTVCSQPQFLVPGAIEARCIDAQRMHDVGGKHLQSRLKGNRPECGCYESRDIGDYDTCPHGCVYCYAVRNRSLALERYQQHDPEGEFLVPRQRKRKLANEKIVE